MGYAVKLQRKSISVKDLEYEYVDIYNTSTSGTHTFLKTGLYFIYSLCANSSSYATITHTGTTIYNNTTAYRSRNFRTMLVYETIGNSLTYNGTGTEYNVILIIYIPKYSTGTFETIKVDEDTHAVSSNMYTDYTKFALAIATHGSNITPSVFAFGFNTEYNGNINYTSGSRTIIGNFIICQGPASMFAYCNNTGWNSNTIASYSLS
jgi:hypothetical protein